MAKTKLSSDELKIDDELDIPSFDFDFGEPKDDRSPVEQILTGVKEGTKSAFKNTGFIRRLLRASMPPVYGEAEDLVDLTLRNTTQLYNKAAREIKPSISQIAKSAENLIPAKHKRSKKSIQAIKEWADEYKTRGLSDESKNDIRDKSIGLNVADVFSTIADSQEGQYQESKIRDSVKESLNLVKHKESIGVLDDIRHHISRLNQYNERITQAFQKKTLELQYRSYFTQVDLVEQGKLNFELSKTSYLSIIKNTALPEYVKLRDSERFKELAKTKMIETLFGTTSSFINKTFKNIGVKVADYTELFKDTLSTAAMGMDTADLAKQSMEMSGKSMKEVLAEQGTEAAVQYAGMRLGGKVKDKIDKNEKLKGFFNNAQYGISNGADLITNYANSQNIDDSPLKAGFKNILKDLIGNQGPDSSLITDNSLNSSGMGLFSIQTNKSIIEIIPGYLSRILREVQVLRTGDDNIGLTSYDPYSNKFKDQKALKKSILEKLIPQGSIRSHEETGKDIFELVDPNNKLTEEQRAAILENLTKDKFNRKLISPERLQSSKTFSNDDRIKDSAKDIAKVFEEYFTDGGKLSNESQEFKDRRNKLSRRTGRIGKFFNNPASEIQNLVNLGYYDQLRELGLINENGSSVNMDEVMRRHTFTGLDSDKEEDTKSFIKTNIANRNNGLISKNTSADTEKLAATISEKLTENSTILKDFLSKTSENQNRFDTFIKENINVLSGLEGNLGNISSKDEVVKTNEILVRIEDFLINKLKFIIPGGPGQLQKGNGVIKDNLLNNLKGLIDKTIGSFWKGVGKPLSSKLLSTVPKTIDLSKKSLTFGLDKVGKATNFLANLLIKARDVFVEGEILPRITAAGLKAGKYRDAVTGKIIKTVGDLKKLKGDVIDEEGNLVLSLSDVKKTFVKKIEGTGIFKLAGIIGEKAIDFSKYTSGQFFKGIELAKGAFGLAKKGLTFLLDGPTDIYLKGSSTPIMLAIIMRNGGYISSSTKKPIMRPSKIDGPVLDLEGNYVLTAEQLKIGLVDKFGKPITTPLMKLLGVGIGIAKFGVQTALKIGKFGKDLIQNGIGKTGDLFKGLLDSISVGIGGKKSYDVLIDIRDILDKRLPGKKNIIGDNDGDGDRDNSWQDILSRKTSKSDKEKDKPKDSTVQTGRQNTFDRIAEAAGNVKDKILGALGLGDDDDDVDVDIDRNSKGRRRKGGKMGKKSGVLGKVGRTIGKVGGLALSAGGWLGRGLLTAGAAALPFIGSALGATASAIATAVPALLAGAGAVLSSPITLTVAALAALGYGGYKAYQYFSNRNYSNLSKMRFAQYGLSIDEKNYYPKMEEIEAKILPKVKYAETNANFDIDDAMIPELLKIFGIDASNSDNANLARIQKWTHWFINRFKPVYLVHLTALQKLGSKVSLTGVDSLDAETKIKYINAASYSDGPYSDLTSPIPDLRTLEAGSDLVNYYSAEALKQANEDLIKEKKDPKKSSELTTPGVVAAAGTTAAALTKNGNASSNVKPNETSWFASKIKENLTLLKSPLMMLNPFVGLGLVAFKVVGQAILENLGFGVSALEAVRLKTYGIKELTRSKVSSIRNLEKMIIDKITFDSEGRAYYTEPLADILTKVGPEFGISALNSPNAQKFLTWIQQRFLPVYLNYLGLVRQVTGSGKASRDETGLKDQDKLDIAKKVLATIGVWTVTVSPWENEISNTDDSVTKDNIRYLEDQAKDAKSAEEKKSGAVAINGALQTANTTADATKKITKATQPQVSTDPGAGGTWDRVNSNENGGSSPPNTYKDKYDVKTIDAKNKQKAANGFGGFGDDVDKHISEASQKYNIDEKVLRGFVKMEAGWTGKMSPTGAIGAGQFTQGTWDSLAQTPEGKEIGMTKIGKRFRQDDDPRHDKRTNILATALLAKKNAEMLSKNNIPVNGENLYMMHNVGPGFMNAVNGGEVSPQTLKAMQLNGMKPGMTPASFVEYQKGRFNSHYDTANGGEKAVAIAPDSKVNRRVDTVNTARDAIRGFRSNAQIQANENNNSVVGPSPGASQPNGGYAGSVERTKPNPSIVTPPSYTQDQLPKNADDLSSIMRRNRELAARADRSSNVDPRTVISSQVNNAVSGIRDIVGEQLDVQKQMLSALQDISTKVGPGTAKQSAPAEKPASAPSPEKPSVMNTGVQEPRKTNALPKAPVVLNRS